MQHHPFFTRAAKRASPFPPACVPPACAQHLGAALAPLPRARRFSWARGAALSLALGFALSCVPAPARAQSALGSVRGAGYLLGPGDVLSLSVAGYPEFNQSAIAVPPDGSVTLPRFGTVRLSGRTRLAVQNEMRDILMRRLRFRNASALALSITTFRPAPPTFVGRVILSGDVPRPGSFEVRARQHLSDLLAEAGLSERLEERRATLTRGAKRVSLDLKRAAQTPGSAADLALRPGDSIAVSALVSGKITVSGDVARPGVYELHRAPRSEFEIGASPRLSDLLTRAGWQRGGVNASGGATGGKMAGGGAGAKSGIGAQETSTSSGTGGAGGASPAWTGTLQRGGQTRVIRPDAAFDRVGGAQDVSLRAGDFVTVSQVPPITVYVDGLVARPSSYSLAPGTGVLELLTQAGGLTRAPGDIIAGVRRGNQTLPLDLNSLLLSSDSGANLPLQNGDYVQLRPPETLDVLIAGQVGKPGIVQIKPGAAVFEAINQAGGIVGTTEEVRMSVLRRESDGSQRILPVNASAVLGATDMATNYPLQRGDVINVARLGAQTVFINGEVVNTGSFTLRVGEGLTELLTRAGGVKDDASLTRVNVTRGAQVLQVDAFDAVKKGTPLEFALKDGDQVLVPKNPNQVAVLEAVAKPGTYSIPERGQLTLIDVLTQAAPIAGAREVFVVHARADGTFDTKNVPSIKLDALRRGKTPNIVLQAHDVVFVPAPKSSRSLLDRVGQLSVLRLFF